MEITVKARTLAITSYSLSPELIWNTDGHTSETLCTPSVQEQL